MKLLVEFFLAFSILFIIDTYFYCIVIEGVRDTNYELGGRNEDALGDLKY